MRDPPRPAEAARRGRGPAFRFRLWHVMVAVLVTALGFGAYRSFGPVLLVFPMLIGLALLACVLTALLKLFLVGTIIIWWSFGLLFAWVATISQRIGRGDRRISPGEPSGPAHLAGVEPDA